MKPFDLEKAKAGAELRTRDGRPARIICWDRQSDGFPIVALVSNGEREDIYKYPESGEKLGYKLDALDLFMAPEKKEGWVNVYKDLAKYITGGDYIHPTKEEAERQKSDTCIATVKIEWEE